MKICTKCNLSKPESEFRIRKRDNKRYPHCNECQRLYVRNHYANNKQYYINKAKKRNEELKAIIVEYVRNYLLAHPCVVCDESDIIVLQFDHIKDKSYNIGRMISEKMDLELIKLEIDKCQILCANCHIRKTAKDFSWWRQQ